MVERTNLKYYCFRKKTCLHFVSLRAKTLAVLVAALKSPKGRCHYPCRGLHCTFLAPISVTAPHFFVFFLSIATVWNTRTPADLSESWQDRRRSTMIEHFRPRECAAGLRAGYAGCCVFLLVCSTGAN